MLKNFHSRRRSKNPIPPGDPTGDNIVISAALRSRSGVGSGLINGGIWFKKGHVDDAIIAARKLKVEIGGVEQSIAIKVLNGRHSDGSIRAILIQLIGDIPDIVNDIACEVIIGEVRTTADLSIVAVTPSIYAARRVICLTDTAYMCDTMITGMPLLPSSNENVHNADYFGTLFRQRFNGIKNNEINVGNYQSTYESNRGLLARYCIEGDHEFYDQAYRRTYELLTRYSLSDPNQYTSWNPEPNQNGLPGVNADGTPAEQHSQRYVSYICAYYMTGLDEYWNVVCAHQQAFKSAVNTLTIARGNNGHVDDNYGVRFNLVGLWPMLLGVFADATKVYANPAKFGSGGIFDFPTEIPWILDAMDFHSYPVASGYREGLNGMRYTATNSGKANPGHGPTFQFALQCDMLMFYYINVHADPLAAQLVKQNVDVIWDNNIFPLESGMPMFGIGSHAYSYMVPDNAGQKAGTEPSEPPVWGADPYTIVMWAPAIAFCKALFGDAKYTTYLAIATNKGQVQSPQLTWSWKIFGETFGNSLCTPYFDQIGMPPDLPSSIRTPIQY